MPSQELVTRVKAGWPNEPPVPTCTWFLIATTNARKTAGYGCLLGLLEQGQLVLPRHPDLLRQLAGLRFEQGERGFTRIEAETAAVHDDIADALMLATMPYQPPGTSRVKCHLAQLARIDGAISDTPIARSDQVIETSGGLRLPRRLHLQSIAGPELTPPADALQQAAAADHPSFWNAVRERIEQQQPERTSTCP